MIGRQAKLLLASGLVVMLVAFAMTYFGMRDSGETISRALFYAGLFVSVIVLPVLILDLWNERRARRAGNGSAQPPPG